MACPATPLQVNENAILLHPRGHAISVVYTCPGCGMIIIANRLNRRNGVNQCRECKLSVMIGLALYLLPLGPGASQSIASDYTLPPAERSMPALRRRTRKRRIAYLASVGLDPSMQPASLERYQRGSEINRVVVVQPPSECTPPPGV